MWTETTWVPFGTLSMCLPLKTLFHFPLNTVFFPFFTLGDWTPFHNIVLVFGILIIWSNMKFHCSFQFVDSSVSHCVEQFLDHTMPSQSDVERKSAILTCTILPGFGLKAFHSQCMVTSYIEILDVVISQSHTDQVCESLFSFIRFGCTAILVDHVHNFGQSFELVALRQLLFFGW